MQQFARVWDAICDTPAEADHMARLSALMMDFSQQPHRLSIRITTGIWRSLKPQTNRRTRWLSKKATAIALIQLNTTHAGRFAIRHARNSG